MQKIWLYGLHACKHALHNKERKPTKVLVTNATYESTKEWLIPLTANIPLSIASVQTINNILTNKTNNKNPNFSHQGIALLTTQIKMLDLNSYIYAIEKSNNEEILLCLDQIQDTTNLGSIFRTATAFNVNTILLPKKNSAPITPAVTKTACGALEKIKIIYVDNLSRSLENLKKIGFWIYGLDARAQESIKNYTNHHKKIVLIIGSEDKGIRPLVKRTCDHLLKIEINSTNIESLNASVATAIALHQIYQAP
ncbi:23S rRNA (guanosine2251-2'-O)-methyltransferase [Candidatus Xenohaliotis californiensis]|uniref:23S rRNA (Guanosine2251-2'-O)-methyltransferase n=1 Tax=Candidatus Xenohaliotis californiensis TaxID=84677 RepID=A0ABP0ERQ7_9RICK|nr:23S rRNA (guanosine2251-2'-O)-methyltransferase [Candidatus Xenohaliotis californiensis]